MENFKEMNEFLASFKQPKLNQEETNKINRFIKNEDLNSDYKKLSSLKKKERERAQIQTDSQHTLPGFRRSIAHS